MKHQKKGDRSINHKPGELDKAAKRSTKVKVKRKVGKDSK